MHALDHGAVGQHRLQARHPRPRRAVGERARPAGVAGHEPADGCRVARGEVDAGIESGRGRRCLQRGHGHARAGRQLGGGRVHRAHLVQARQRHQHLTPARHPGAHQPGVAALGHDGGAVPRQAAITAATWAVSAGRTTHAACRAEAPGPVALVALAHAGVGEHVVRPHRPGQVFNQHRSGKLSHMPPTHETVFTLEATPVKFGPGAVDDAGWELSRLGVSRALLVTDPRLAALGIPDRVRQSIEAEGIEVVVYDRARVEPTIDSLQEACDFALDAKVDGFVSVGGGSSMDTAKVANLIVTHPAEVMAYVNPPVGEGRKPPSPLAPHLAVPTTSGSGSEATTVAVLDLPELKVKSGISHRYLRCSQAIVDPELTRTLPAEVTSSAGLDVVCHAAESFISKPYDQRERPQSPDDRPPYQGANPVADVWSSKAMEFGGRYLRRAVADAQTTPRRADT